MVDAFIYAYLAAPGLLGLAGLVYALTRAPDRINIAALCLFACSLQYSALAYELISRKTMSPIAGLALGTYAIALYVSTAALAIELRSWARKVSVGAFALHLVSGLAMSPLLLSAGAKGIVALGAYLVVGAIGLWATLHKGSKAAVTSQRPAEA
jgi:hypothetical protein